MANLGRKLALGVTMLVASFAMTGSQKEAQAAYISQFEINAYLECALSDDSSVLQACSCDVSGGEFCRCGTTCCDSWVMDSCERVNYYYRPPELPFCLEYCDYYIFFCVECGCRLGIET